MIFDETEDLECCMVCVMKGTERYLILYSEDNARLALQQLGRWAVNPELSFTWSDAATASGKVLHKRGELP